MVGLRAADEEGELVTVPVPAGKQLHVNADTSRGQITAELLDEAGTVVPGFEREACLPFDDDALDHTITWRRLASKDNHDENLSVRLYLRNAEVFSLWFS